MRASRHLPILAVLAAVAIVGVRGASTGAADAAGAATPTPGDPACASDDRAFRALVETVRAKSDELARREAEVAVREAGLAQARTLVTGEVARLETIAKALGIIGGPDAGMSIVRVLESMSPEDAAGILERLDDATLRTVLTRMRERQVAAILAAMNRERAVAVTKAFAGPPLPATNAPN